MHPTEERPGLFARIKNMELRTIAWGMWLRSKQNNHHTPFFLTANFMST